MATIGEAFVKIKADTAAFQSELKSGLSPALASASASVGASMKQIGASLQDAGKEISKISLPLAAVGVGAIKVAMDFDSSMTRIQALVGLSRTEVESMRDSVTQLSGQTARGPRELGEALFFVTSAGLRGKDALEALEFSAKASAIGLGDTKVVADLVTSAMNAYGSEVLSAEQATDALTMAVRLGKLEPSQLAGAMGQVLPVASAMGVSFQEVGAAFAAMSRTGTNANVAATQLRGILTQLLSPSVQATKALEELGFSVEGIRASIAEKGLIATLQDMVEAFDGNVVAMEAVFGNVRALSGVLDMLGANVADTEMILLGMKDAAGVTNEAFEIVSQTAEHKMQQAFANLETAMVNLGSVFLPIVSKIADSIAGMAQAFADLPTPVMNAIGAVGGFVAILGPGLFIAGSLAKSLGAILMVAPALSTAIAGLAAKFSLLGGPVGIAVGAFALLVAASPELRSALGGIATIVGRALVDSIRRLTPLINGLVDVVRVALQEFAALAKVIGDIGSAVDDFLSKIPVLNAGLSGSAESGGVFGAVLQALEDGLNPVGVGIDNVTKGLEWLGFNTEGTTAHVRQFGDQTLQASNIIENEINIALANMQHGMGEVFLSVDETTNVLARMREAGVDFVAVGLQDLINTIGETGITLAMMQEAVTPWVESIVEAAGTARDSFFGLRDDALDSLDSMIDAMFNQLAAFNNWKENMIALAGIASAGVVAHFMEVGPGGAVALQELIDTGGEKLDALEALVAAKADATVDSLLGPMIAANPELAAIFALYQGTVETGMQEAEVMASFRAQEIGKTIPAGIADGVSIDSNNIANTTVEGLTKAFDGATRYLQVRSPSGLFRDRVGKPMIAGVAEGIKQGASGAETEMRNVLTRIIGASQTAALQSFTAGSSAFRSSWQSSWGQIVSIAESAGSSMQRAFTSAANSMQNTTTSLMQSLRRGWDEYRQNGEQTLRQVQTAFLQFTNQIQTTFLQMVNAITQAWQRLGQQLVSTLTSTISDVRGRASSGGQEIGSALIDGTIRGIQNRQGGLATALVNAVRRAVDAAKAAARVSSPSKVTEEELGRPLMEGIIKGITDDGKLVQVALLSAVLDPMSDMRAESQNLIRVTSRTGRQFVVEYTLARRAVEDTNNAISDGQQAVQEFTGRAADSLEKWVEKMRAAAAAWATDFETVVDRMVGYATSQFERLAESFAGSMGRAVDTIGSGIESISVRPISPAPSSPAAISPSAPSSTAGGSLAERIRQALARLPGSAGRPPDVDLPVSIGLPRQDAAGNPVFGPAMLRPGDPGYSASSSRGPAVQITNATFVAPMDAEKIAQKVLVAERARALAS